MRTKLCTTLLFVFAFSIIHAQMDVQTEFETFAKKQNELFMKAYESRDVNTYQIVLGDFFVQFNKLGSADKKNSPYQQNAFYNLCCTYSLFTNKPGTFVIRGCYTNSCFPKQKRICEKRTGRIFLNSLPVLK